MDRYRLPRTVVPSRYDLRLAPDLAAATFAGRADIAVMVHEPVEEIVLNAAELQIGEAVAEGQAGQPAGRGRDAGGRYGALPAAFRVRPGERRAGGSSCPSPGRSTTSCAASTAANTRTRTANGAGWPPRSSRPPTPAAPSPAGTSRPSRPSSPPRSSSIRPCAPSPTPPSPRSASRTASKVVRFADTIPMSTYLVAYIVGELEATEPVMVGAHAAARLVRAGQAAADAVRPATSAPSRWAISRSITAANIPATSST